jgi:hypothetical protein
MGYQAPLELAVKDDERWVGEHRPELIDLEPIFRRLVDIDSAQLEPGIASASEAWRAALPEDVHLIRMLSPRAVHIHCPRSLVVRDLVIKLYLPHADRKWRRLTERMAQSRSHRAHLWGHRLRAIGIDTPRPLGYIERSEKPSRYVSFAATEYVLAPTLIELKDTGMSMLRVPGNTAVLEKRALIERLAAVLRAMHAHGMFLVDPSPTAFFVAGKEVMVADVDSMNEALRSGKASVDGLVALHRAFADARALTKTDRLRFLRTYLRHEADRESRIRALWFEVFEKSMMRA